MKNKALISHFSKADISSLEKKITLLFKLWESIKKTSVELFNLIKNCESSKWDRHTKAINNLSKILLSNNLDDIKRIDELLFFYLKQKKEFKKYLTDSYENIENQKITELDDRLSLYLKANKEAFSKYIDNLNEKFNLNIDFCCIVYQNSTWNFIPITEIDYWNLSKLITLYNHIPTERRSLKVDKINNLIIESNTHILIKIKDKLTSKNSGFVAFKKRNKNNSIPKIVTAISLWYYSLDWENQNIMKNIIDRISVKWIIDELTNFYYRWFWLFYFKEMLIALQKGQKLQVLYIDLNNFKKVNDTYGHTEGDNLLIEIWKIINHNFRYLDPKIRIWWDEFIIITSLQEEILRKKLENIKSQFQNIINQNNNLKNLWLGLSVGIIEIKKEKSDTLNLKTANTLIEQIINLADTQMYEAKQISRNNTKILNYKKTTITI